MKAIRSNTVTVAIPTRPEVPTPAIVRSSRGIANNVQQGYAQWQRGMKNRARG